MFNIVLSLDLSKLGRLSVRALSLAFRGMVPFRWSRHNEFVATEVPAWPTKFSPPSS